MTPRQIRGSRIGHARDILSQEIDDYVEKKTKPLKEKIRELEAQVYLLKEELRTRKESA